MSDCISFGGGVNSVALTVLLVSEGWRGPIVMAATGCEWPATLEYTAAFERDWLQPRGLCIEHVGAEHRSERIARMHSVEGYALHYGMAPSPYARWCTRLYKTVPINAWADAHAVTVQHLGIAADESHRTPDASRPLCERGITRQGCIDIIRDAGLDVPRKSACWCCPFQTRAEWRELYETHPDLYERAAALEDAATERRGVYTTLDPSGRWTLRDLGAQFEAQPRLVGEHTWEAVKC